MIHRTQWILLCVAALSLTVGCSSDGGFSTDRSCEAITCGENATCAIESGVPLCTCNEGYEGGRQTCYDIDECALGTDDCTTLCVNTPGSFTCVAPSTCAEIQDLTDNALDGDYLLYVEGDESKPWQAYCYDMLGTRDECRNCTLPPEDCPCDPLEYLPLVQLGATSNYAQYEATTDGRTGKDIHTTYSKVRIDPVTFAVDVTDSVFSESMGEVIYDQQEITIVPYGTALSCDRFDAGAANIDLTGTPFYLTSGFCRDGFGGDGQLTISADSRVADMSISGGCAWYRSDDACASHPFDDTASVLALDYSPYIRRVFVSSETVGSDIGGLVAADAKCQELASNAGLPGNYAAWLGSPQGHPAERFVQYQVRYQLVDGTVVANNWLDLSDGTLRHAIDLDESGNTPAATTIDCTGLEGVENTAVWTGTDADGEDFGVDWNCNDWTGSGERFGVGSYVRSGRGWSDACRVQAPGTDVCQGQFAHLYCFEL